MVLIVSYKIVIEPAQMKKSYLSCMDTAKTDDYDRWQTIEEDIRNKDRLVKELGIEADHQYGAFLDDNSREQTYIRCVENCEKACSGDQKDTINRWTCNACKDKEKCISATHKVMFEQVREEQASLRSLYESMDANGAILEKELEDCKNQYILFK